jgi:D-glycero-D-manno-heptose 1,7-bisphosphate phosphatase
MGIHGTLKRPAVFLDRDGVINRAFERLGAWHPPASLAELEILPGVPAALNALRACGYSLVVVTNQPDVARGSSSRALVDAIHARLASALPLDAILSCFHDSADECQCRKPRPGLLLQAARDLQIELSLSFMVGDRWCDVEAGRRAGCRTVLVGPGDDERAAATCHFRVDSLAEATPIIMARSGAA